MKHQLLPKLRGCFAFAAAVLFCALGFSAKAQAPASIAGDAFLVNITGGTGNFSGGGAGLLLIANSGNNYTFEIISGLSSSSGSVTYSASGADGLVNVVDSHVGSFTGDFNFTDATDGTFSFNQSSSGSTQNGTFSLFTGHAPSSVAGKTFELTFVEGGGGNSGSGTYEVAFTASGFSVIKPGSTNSGTYTYSLANASTAKVVATGTHPNTIFISFATATNGVYASTNTLGQYELGTFTVPDTQAPTNQITAPTANLSVSNADFTVTGKAGDNAGVAAVHYQINNGTWFLAGTTNGWTNWSAGVELSAGTNIIKAYATDAANNNSATQMVSFVYVVSAPLALNVVGSGTVTPNDNGALLAVGKSYTLTAKASTGFKFTGWTGTQSTTNSAITFQMASNFNLIATFVDSTAPSIIVTVPKIGATVSNASLTLAGTAKDNVGVATVNYQLNNGSWFPAGTTNGWTNWNANLTLTPGTNVIKAYAQDATANNSTTQTVTLFYVVTAPLTVQTNGHGTVTPNDNGALLEIGKSYSLKATASTGFKFTGWTGSQSTTNSSLTFLMASDLTFTANFVDATAPTLLITAPKANSNVSNADFNVTGTIKDNVGVTSVSYQLNSGSWTPANVSNSSNWNAQVSLTPGTNIIKAYAADAAGNSSTTQSVSFVYVVSSTLTVITNGSGTVTPNMNGEVLAIGKSFTMTAKAGTGFAFTSWTGTGGISNNLAALTFQMSSNLVLTANFIDIQKPTVKITSPTAGLRISNANYMVMGTASDNVGVAGVLYQLNGGEFLPAQTVNGWTNWIASISLVVGTNVVHAYSVDAAGNVSTNATVTFVAVAPPDWAPDSLADLSAVVTPDGESPVIVTFGSDTLSQTVSDTNDMDVVGNYTYSKLSTNTAQLVFNFTLPPNTSTGTNVVNITFTNLNAGVFTQAGGGDSGTIVATAVDNLARATMNGKTISATNTSGTTTVSFGTSTFNEQDPDGSKSGNYVYQQYSPLVGMLSLTYTSPSNHAGSTSFVYLDFSTTSTGTLTVVSFDNLGDLNGTDSATFGIH